MAKEEGRLQTWVSKKRFTEKVSLEKRLEGNEEGIHVDSVGNALQTEGAANALWGRSTPGEYRKLTSWPAWPKQGEQEDQREIRPEGKHSPHHEEPCKA